MNIEAKGKFMYIYKKGRREKSKPRTTLIKRKNMGTITFD